MIPRLWRTRAFVAGRLRSVWLRRIVLFVAAPLALLLLLLSAVFIHYVYRNRSGLPDIEGFIRFEPPTTGKVYDARGKVLIELAHEYRRVVSYDEVPVVVREAVLAAEDKSFFSHGGVDYSALPRVIQKTAVRTLTAWWNGARLRLLLPQGGSTLTQQLVRAYFLREQTSQQEGDALFHGGLPQRLLAVILGVPKLGTEASYVVQSMYNDKTIMGCRHIPRPAYYAKEASPGIIMRRIAPKRLNPEGRAWLPILHTRRGRRHYTALFSNTPARRTVDQFKAGIRRYMKKRHASR